MGKRLRTEFDFSEAPTLLNRLGFVFLSKPAFGQDSIMILASVPLWPLEVILIGCVLTKWFSWRRRRNMEPEKLAEKLGLQQR
jgi:hypothetical protein